MYVAIAGDITGDAAVSLAFWNQHGGACLYRVALPEDATVSPWPGLEVIAAGMVEEGQPEEGLAIGDVDGDGRNEIVVSEGDPLVYGRSQGGSLAWFKPGADARDPLAGAHSGRRPAGRPLPTARGRLRQQPPGHLRGRGGSSSHL